MEKGEQLDIFSLGDDLFDSPDVISPDVIPEIPKTDNNESSYHKRQNNINQGEELFEKYMAEKGYSLQRFGFDEKKYNIDGFQLMHPLLRSLPDYISYFKNQNKLIYFHIKGTNKIKIEDLIQYSTFENMFCTNQAILRVAFCFKDKEPIVKSISEIKKMITGLSIGEWHDKKQFISLNLWQN